MKDLLIKNEEKIIAQQLAQLPPPT